MTAVMGGRWSDGWYVVPHQAIFRDLDAIGHVNHAVFLTYFEWARMLFWFDLTGGSQPFDIGFIVARAECDYRHQLGMEPIEICVRIGEMRTTSLDFLHEIRKDGGQVAAAARIVVVLFDWNTQSKVTISDDLRRKVKSLQQSEA
jgi:acyl-CoA thioester hydrolase